MAKYYRIIFCPTSAGNVNQTQITEVHKKELLVCFELNIRREFVRIVLRSNVFNVYSIMVIYNPMTMKSLSSILLRTFYTLLFC